MSSPGRVRRLHRALRLALASGGSTRLYLSGVCLAPLIPPGRAIHLVDRPPRVGEVAVYETAEGWAAHRVVAITEEALLIRADRPGSGIERVPRERVVGVWAFGRRVRSAALLPGVGRAVQRLSLAVSTERLLPRLRRLRDGVRRRLGPSRSPEIREIEALSAAYLRDLSRLGLWLDAAVSEVEDGASRRPLVLALVSGRRLWGGVRVDPRGEGGVIQIALEPALRGRGHGRALLAHTVAVARARGLAFLDAEIARDNQASLALFRGAGFTLEAPAVAVHLRRRTPFDRYRLDLR